MRSCSLHQPRSPRSAAGPVRPNLSGRSLAGSGV